MGLTEINLYGIAHVKVDIIALQKIYIIPTLGREWMHDNKNVSKEIVRTFMDFYQNYMAFWPPTSRFSVERDFRFQQEIH